MRTVSLPELVARLQADPRPTLVEALPAHYFQREHLPGAININVGEVAAKAPQLLPDRQAPVVVYCASVTCANSDQVAAQLQALGYADVAVYKGGKAEWLAAGNAFEQQAA